MSWNYRIVQKTMQFQGEEHTYCDLHEVYYDENGQIDGWTMNPITMGGFESGEEMKASLELILKAFDKPTLIEKDDTLVPLNATNGDDHA